MQKNIKNKPSNLSSTLTAKLGKKIFKPKKSSENKIVRIKGSEKNRLKLVESSTEKKILNKKGHGKSKKSFLSNESDTENSKNSSKIECDSLKKIEEELNNFKKEEKKDPVENDDDEWEDDESDNFDLRELVRHLNYIKLNKEEPCSHNRCGNLSIDLHFDNNPGEIEEENDGLF